MTLAEAKLTLRIDTDYDDNQIQNLIDAIPSYIYQKTGLKPEKQSEEPLVKVVSDFLIITWFQHNESEIYDKTIESLLTTIKLKVIESQALEKAAASE